MAKGDCKTLPLPSINEKGVERFWESFKRGSDSECWIWLGSRYESGYGQFHAQGRCLRASRVSYWLNYGVDPYPLYVLHTCDNPPCVNPFHLFLGDAGDNMQDALSKGHRKTGDAHWTHTNPELVLRGAAVWKAKLTEADVLDIRAMWADGERDYGKLADMFGVNRTTVNRVILRKTWINLP